MATWLCSHVYSVTVSLVMRTARHAPKVLHCFMLFNKITNIKTDPKSSKICQCSSVYMFKLKCQLSVDHKLCLNGGGVFVNGLTCF